MSQDKIQRRRFLADVLFAAGALSAAALAAKGMTPAPPQSTPTPALEATPEVTPACSESPKWEAPVPGQMRAPLPTSPGAAKAPLPHPEGDVVQPKSKETHP